MTIKVKNCKSCPFSTATYSTTNPGFNYANCYAPVEIHTGEYKIDSYYKNYKSPKWCPLKNQSLKIEFNGKR